MPNPRWTSELLVSLRAEMDPPADRAVAAVYESNEVSQVNALLGGLIAGRDVPVAELPKALQDYLAETSAMPAWLDPAKVTIGEEVFGAWGVNSCAILACASLPECYMMEKGIHVLAMTKRIQNNAQRRVLETAQMIMAVMFPGGISPNGVGVRTAQKVRLMHAAIRFLILHKAGGPPAMAPPTTLGEVAQREVWQPTYGQPINQEDLLYTLMTFSHVALRSFDRLGAQLTDAEKDAYIHTWNVAGYFMGIRADVMPANHTEAAELFELIKSQQGGGTPEAQAMENALIDFMNGFMPHGPLKRLPAYITRHLVGDQTADMVGVPRVRFYDRLLLSVLISVWRLIDDTLSAKYRTNDHVQFASAWFQDLLMAEIGKLPNAWNKQLFGLPGTLRADLPPDWDHPPAKAPSALTGTLMRQL